MSVKIVEESGGCRGNGNAVSEADEKKRVSIGGDSSGKEKSGIVWNNKKRLSLKVDHILSQA